MDLTELLYQPYIISIIIALIFTFIVYLILKRNNNDKKTEKINQKSYAKTLTITFFCSFIAFLGLIYGMRHLSNTKTEIMSGGGSSNCNSISVADLSEKLNISGNDVDFGLLDN
jgi:predicted PurR-regulated permease PerM